MKYTIEGFSQKVLIDYKLDITDALILRWFIDFKDSGKMYVEMINEKTMYWVKYEKVLEDLPILNMGKEPLARRFKKLVKAGVLVSFLKKEKGTFTMFGVGEKYINLVSGDHSTQKSNGGRLESRTGADSKVETKNSYINKLIQLNNNISKAIGSCLPEKELERLIAQKGLTKIEELIKNWPLVTLGRVVGSPVHYFIKCLDNGFQVKTNNVPSQMADRSWERQGIAVESEEELEKYYS